MQRFASLPLAGILLAAALGAAGAAEVPAVPAMLDLDSSLALALEHNYSIQQARAFYAQNTGAVMTSESGRLPTVSAFGGYTQIDPTLVSIPGGSENSWQTGVQASQVLYSGGAVSSSIKSSRLTRDAAESGFAEAVQSALLQVRIRWYDVLLAREQVGVQEQFIVLLQEELSNARSRVKAGSGSPFEQLRAEVALANGQPGLIRARNAYHVAAVDLLRAIGLPSDESTADRVTGQLLYVPREISLETALTSAQTNRPEIRRLENLLTAAEASVDTARAGSRPTVAVVGGYTVEKAQVSGPGADGTVEGWTFGAQASWDIFDGKATRGRVLQSKAGVEQARLSLADTRLAIDADVRRSHASYLDSIELVNSSLKVIEQAEESLRLARSRFGAGAATQLDVLQTQVALTDARSNAAQARHDVSVAYAFLERSAALSPLPSGVSIEQPAE